MIKVRRLLISIGILLLSEATLAFAPQVPQRNPGKAYQEFADFRALRSQILELIGNSRLRVFLISDFLTDGEISSALYLAKYRKLSVNVLLSTRKAKRYLSRVDYLKRQGVNVLHRPRGLSLTDPTLLMIDNSLYRISRDLDVLRPDIPARMVQVPPKVVNRFLSDLVKSFKDRKEFKRVPIPKVGRPRRKNLSRRYKPYKKLPAGAYDYDQRRPRSRPPHVPANLPKSTIYQKKQRQRIMEQEQLKEATSARKKEANQDHLNINPTDPLNSQNHETTEELNDQL